MTQEEWDTLELAYEMLVESAGKVCSCIRYRGELEYKCIQCRLRELLEKYKGGGVVALG